MVLICSPVLTGLQSPLPLFLFHRGYLRSSAHKDQRHSPLVPQGDLARLRLSRLLLTEGDKDAALSLIEKGDSGKFASSYHELRGDILLQQGDSKAAQDAYTQALATQNSIRSNQSIVQMKLDDLGVNQL